MNRPAHRSRTRVLAVLLLVMAVGTVAALGGRAALHRWKTRPVAASHAMTGGQLASLGHPADRGDERGPRQRTSVADTPSPPPIAQNALVAVPYTVQAPFANWRVHEESCEEAVLLMYHDLLTGDRRADIPPQEADEKLRALKAWQVANWGAERDLDMETTGKLAKGFFGHGYGVVPATRDSISAQLTAGSPVIVSVMTHALQNPHYGPKSVYHELLITGYKSDGVVTNDPGVAEGKNWFYSWPVLFAAIDSQTPHTGQGRLGLVLART